MQNSDSEYEDWSPEEFKIRKIVASNIRKYRESRHMTQEMLAEKMDMTSVTISRLENMQQWPSSKTLLALTTALDIRPYQIFMEEGAENIVPTEFVVRALERSIKTFNSEMNPILQNSFIKYSIDHE